MSKWKSSLKYFRLTLFFAFVVFLILIVTMSLAFLGVHLLTYMGFVGGDSFDRFPLFAFCLCSVLIGTFLAAVFSKAPLRPMREIIAATDRIADGDYNVRISLKGPDEFRILSEKFNHMAEELGSVEVLRRDFVNNFSHEFKTPIVSIRGFAKALKWDDLTEDERNEYLDIIISESERLSTLSANVLYLSKIENQTILTNKKRLNLSEQIRLVIALLDRKFTKKELSVSFDNKEYYVTGNEEMLKQVWINLIDNAIKFSPERGKIDVCVNETDDKIVVQIRDEGDGISPEAQTHIFDKFYQGDRSHTTEGNGLGLAIVKKIVCLHGGRITVHSSEKGTVFEVTMKKYNE